MPTPVVSQAKLRALRGQVQNFAKCPPASTPVHRCVAKYQTGARFVAADEMTGACNLVLRAVSASRGIAANLNDGAPTSR